MTTPTKAAIVVVISSVPRVSTEIRPSAEASCSRDTALRIAAKTSGITTICSNCT